MAITTLSSPLASVANKIVSVNSRTGTSLVKAQSEYKKFGDFLDFKRQELERIPLPDDKKIQKLSNINVVNTFGSAGGLLGGLLGGALDLGGLVRGFFPGEGKKVGAAPQVGKPKTKPVIKSGKLRLGGIRALGVTNALFAGLDFATGLAEGESVGKSAAGTSGALAGSLLGGAIGQALIPIPGVGFVIGSAAGNFLGGYGADRTYEAVESQRIIKAKQEAKLREQSQAVERSKPGKVENQNNILDKFDDVANKFEGFVKGIVGGIAGLFGNQRNDPYGPGSTTTENDTAPPNTPTSEDTQNYSGGGKIVQYLHGEKGRAGYDVGHAGEGNAHDHFSFTSREAAITAFKALEAAGYKPYEFEGFGAGVTPPGLVNGRKKGHELTGGHYGPVGLKGTVGKNDDGTAFDIPWITYGSGPIGPKDYAKSRRAHQIVLQALSSSSSSKAGGQATAAGASTAMVQTGVKPGQVTSTAFGKQGSTNIANYGAATKTNIKGFIIVPGHIAGDGTPGEIAATQKIAKNIVDKLQKKYPGVPIQFWNHRNYEQTDPGYIKEMNDLKKLESEGWEIIEIHMDASIESGKGTGRGVIVPTGGKNLNEFDTRFAAQKGSYPSNHRGGLVAPKRNLTMVETGNVSPQALSALNNGDQSAVDFFSSDTIQILEQLIKEGKIGGGYRPPQSQVNTPPAKTRDVSHQLSYNQRTSSTVILDRPSAIIAAGGGGSSRPTVIPSSSGGGGGTVVVAASPYQAERITLNKLQQLALG
jgi:hypothetical protein